MKVFANHHKRVKRVLSCQGFTLIETILTITFLSLGLGGTMLLFSSVTGHSLESDHRVSASQLAHEKTEQIIADKTFRGYAWIDEANYPDEALNPPYNNYTRAVTIAEVNASDLATPETGSGVKRVDVNVTWGAEASQNIEMTTLVSSY